MSNLERVTYFNGNYVPESEVKVHFRDRSFKYGDGVFDMTRTFGHKIFKIEEHVERLYKSLNYMDIKIDISKNEMVDISKAVLEKNLHLLGPNEDYWVGQRISRGVDKVGGEQGDVDGGPTHHRSRPDCAVQCPFEDLPVAGQPQRNRSAVSSQ